MPDPVRIGVEPPPIPPRRSSRLLIAAGAIVVLAAGVAWLAGAFGGTTPTTTIPAVTFPLPSTTTGPPTTALTIARPLDERLAAARAFWPALGAGDTAAAASAFPATTAAAIDLMEFVAAFRAGFPVGECSGFGADAVQCTVTITNDHLIAIGTGTPEERLVVAETGWFGVPTVLGSAAARLSLYALGAHPAELRAACPATDNPQVLGLAIAGSATAGCGAYLAGLIPEYLAAEDLGGGPQE